MFRASVTLLSGLLTVYFASGICFGQNQSRGGDLKQPGPKPQATAAKNNPPRVKPSLRKPSVVTSPPADLNADMFYTKYVDADGIPVLASAKAPDQALLAARTIILEMLAKRPDLIQALIANKTRVAVIARSEVTTDIPEHRDLNEKCPQTNWDKSTRGVGATKARPVCSAAEENLLNYPQDSSKGESILVHEFAHTIDVMGLRMVDPTFTAALEQVYRKARAQGLWDKTYAASNVSEYWAEGVQSWFNANLEANPPNGIHNAVNTRAELVAYDPELARLIQRVFESQK